MQKSVYTIWVEEVFCKLHKKKKDSPLGKPPLNLSHNVLGTLTALRRLPVDILARILDIARLTVHAVLGVNLEAHPEVLALVFNVLVHACRAEPVLDALVFRVVHLGVLVPVLDLQVHGLVFFVVGAGAGDRGQDVEGDVVVGLGVLDLLALVGGLRGFVVAPAVLEGPGLEAARDVGGEAGVEDAAVDAKGRMEGRPHVSHGFELLPDGRGAELVFVVVEEDGAFAVLASF